MSDPLWRRDEIESPCVNICVVHPEARICTGCYRTIDEISGWSRFSPEERHDIIIQLPDRSGLVKQRRGGRAARIKRG